MFRDVFNIHLPLYAEFCRCVVGFRYIGFGLCFSRLEEPQFSQHSKELAGVPVISLLGFELVEDFDEGCIWISFDTVFYPGYFLFVVSFWLW